MISQSDGLITRYASDGDPMRWAGVPILQAPARAGWARPSNVAAILHAHHAGFAHLFRVHHDRGPASRITTTMRRAVSDRGTFEIAALEDIAAFGVSLPTSIECVGRAGRSDARHEETPS